MENAMFKVGMVIAGWTNTLASVPTIKIVGISDDRTSVYAVFPECDQLKAYKYAVVNDPRLGEKISFKAYRNTYRVYRADKAMRIEPVVEGWYDVERRNATEAAQKTRNERRFMKELVEKITTARPFAKMVEVNGDMFDCKSIDELVAIWNERFENVRVRRYDYKKGDYIRMSLVGDEDGMEREILDMVIRRDGLYDYKRNKRVGDDLKKIVES